MHEILNTDTTNIQPSEITFGKIWQRRGEKPTDHILVELCFCS